MLIIVYCQHEGIDHYICLSAFLSHHLIDKMNAIGTDHEMTHIHSLDYMQRKTCDANCVCYDLDLILDVVTKGETFTKFCKRVHGMY